MFNNFITDVNTIMDQCELIVWNYTLSRLNNINFYQELMSSIRNNIMNGTFDEFHDKYINKL